MTSPYPHTPAIARLQNAHRPSLMFIDVTKKLLRSMTAFLHDGQ
jgi:hypothetical protein